MLNPKYNPDWEEARFLGRGTVTVSQIFYTSPSRCAVADSCAVSLDRRMTFGETPAACSEIECYFPTWAIPKDHKVTKALEEAYTNLYGDKRIRRRGSTCHETGSSAYR